MGQRPKKQLQKLYNREGFFIEKVGGAGVLLTKEKKGLFLDQDIFFRGCGEEERKNKGF